MSNTRKLVRITAKEIITPNSVCETCGRTEWLTLDHIIPKQILKNFGLSEEEMFSDRSLLRILCRSCNSVKASHLDFTDKRTKELLLKLLERF